MIGRRFIVIDIGEASEVFRLQKMGVCHYVLTLNTSEQSYMYLSNRRKMEETRKAARLILEDGSTYDGLSFGSEQSTTGEVG